MGEIIVYWSNMRHCHQTRQPLFNALQTPLCNSLSCYRLIETIYALNIGGSPSCPKDTIPHIVRIAGRVPRIGPERSLPPTLEVPP